MGISYIYAVNELVPSVSILAYKNGKTTLLNTVKMDCSNRNANGAAIRCSKDGKYLYVSLREENAIYVYAVNKEVLTLLQVVDCGGDSPRDFKLFGDFLVCLNENDGKVVVYRIKNGFLTDIGIKSKLAKPLCIV